MKKPKFRGKERIAFWYHAFQKGLNITGQLKYFVAMIGFYDIVANQNIMLAVGLAAAYLVSCFVSGYLWIKHMLTAEIEVSNKFNKFVGEMRRKIR